MDSSTGRRLKSLPVFLLAMAAAGAIIAIDMVVLDRGIIAKNTPSWGLTYWFRSVLAAISALLLVGALVRLASKQPRSPATPIAGLRRFTVLAIPAGALFFVSWLAISPRYFTRLALEDRPVEYFSVLLLLGASVFILLSVRSAAQRTSDARWLLGFPILLAGVFFVIAMEEISWFQRVLSVGTPAALAGNKQGELNFHNLATTPFENAYYFGGFLALVLAPLVFRAFQFRLPESLALFTPTAVVALASAPAFAFNFDRWDVVFSQLAFYGTLAVVFMWLPNELHHRDRAIVYYVGIATIVVQVVLLGLGHRSDRLWDATEYQEMFIPAGFMIYAFDVYQRARALPQTTRSTSERSSPPSARPA